MSFRNASLLSILLVAVGLFGCNLGEPDPGELNQPVLSMPDSVDLTAEDDPEVQADLPVANEGDAELEVAFDHGEPWLEFDPDDLTVDPDGERDVTVRADCDALDDDQDTALATVSVTTNDDRAETTTVTVNLDCRNLDISPTGELRIDVEMPDSVDVEFFVENQDGDVAHSFTATESTIETVDLEPGAYLITVDDPVEDQWNNEFRFWGLDEQFDVGSDDETTREVSTQLPTMVTSETDDETDPPYGSLREVLGRVNPDSEVTFDEDEINEIVLDETITIEDAVSIIGPGDPEDVTLTAAGESSSLLAVDTSGQEVLVQQLSFQDVLFSTSSGAVELLGGDLTLFDTAFRNNTGSAGAPVWGWFAGSETTLTIKQSLFEGNDCAAGGISTSNVDVDIRNTTFEDNIGSIGGAVHLTNGAELTTEETTFEDNEADEYGGAILLENESSFEATRTTFSGNIADEDGGAIAQMTDDDTPPGDVSLRDAHFAYNSADANGGAIRAEAGEGQTARLEIENALFDYNIADDSTGGAIDLGPGARLAVSNSTFVDNDAFYGGAISFGEDAGGLVEYSTFVDNIDPDDTVEGGIVTLTDSLDVSFRANYVVDSEIRSDGDAGEYISEGYNFYDLGDTPFAQTRETDIFDGTPEYEPLTDNGGFTATFALEPGSDGYRDIPADDCRRAHDDHAYDVPHVNQPVNVDDQRGQPRPVGAWCSRGAWEADGHFEDFTTAGLTDQFESGSFDGVDDRTWDYTDVRNEGDYAVQGRPGARFDAADANVRSSEVDGIDGDIDEATVVFRPAGGTDEERSIEVRADGDSVADSGVFGVGVDAADEPAYHVLPVTDFAGDGDFELEVRNTSPDGTGDITIDQISWR